MLLTFIMSLKFRGIWCGTGIAVFFMHLISECLSVVASLCFTVRVNEFLLASLTLNIEVCHFKLNPEHWCCF